MQVTQRIDIFEEEIIKRVREIQKYSKALNTLVKKNVMEDIKKLEERMNAQTSFIETNAHSKAVSERVHVPQTQPHDPQVVDGLKA